MMTVLPIANEHIEEIAELERLCFSSPWSADSLRMLLGDGAIGYVAVIDGRVAAYGGMFYVLDEGQITNIATHPDCRRRGLGRAVTAALTAFGERMGLEKIFLEVRESNAAARSLYSGLGFAEIGTRRGFYKNPTEDAILMEYSTDKEKKCTFSE